MKKQLLLIVAISLMMFSCSSSKNVTRNKKYSKVDKIISHAISYKGTRYKYGGINSNGMDCSGLIFIAFKKEKLAIPRVSRDMAKKGFSIPLNSVKRGDLLFFKTGGSSRINHVGLVTSVRNNDIRFVHSTLKRGVTETLLSNKYWKKAYRKAKRVL